MAAAKALAVMSENLSSRDAIGKLGKYFLFLYQNDMMSRLYVHMIWLRIAH